jgi:Raf kinase inhibitor-like YbhB/YbcL family protein
MAFQLFTQAFQNGGPIPRLYSCEGADLSPTLEWAGEPTATRSFAVVMEDPDAPGGVWTHWVLWDIPTYVHNLAQGHKPGAVGVSGANDFGRPGYGGPCPPKGHGPHRYYFKVLAVDVPSLRLQAGARRRDLDRALQGHIRAEAALMGRYERR